MCVCVWTNNCRAKTSIKQHAKAKATRSANQVKWKYVNFTSRISTQSQQVEKVVFICFFKLTCKVQEGERLQLAPTCNYSHSQICRNSRSETRGSKEKTTKFRQLLQLSRDVAASAERESESKCRFCMCVCVEWARGSKSVHLITLIWRTHFICMHFVRMHVHVRARVCVCVGGCVRWQFMHMK